MPRVVVRFEVDGPDVLLIRALRLSVDGAFVQLGVLARRCVDGVDVDHRHLLVQNLRHRRTKVSFRCVFTVLYAQQKYSSPGRLSMTIVHRVDTEHSNPFFCRQSKNTTCYTPRSRYSE